MDPDMDLVVPAWVALVWVDPVWVDPVWADLVWVDPVWVDTDPEDPGDRRPPEADAAAA